MVSTCTDVQIARVISGKFTASNRSANLLHALLSRDATIQHFPIQLNTLGVGIYSYQSDTSFKLISCNPNCEDCVN